MQIFPDLASLVHMQSQFYGTEGPQEHTMNGHEWVDGFGHNAVLPGFKPLHPLPFFRLGIMFTVALLRLLLLLICLKNWRKTEWFVKIKTVREYVS